MCASARRTKDQESTLTVNRKGPSDQQEGIMIAGLGVMLVVALVAYGLGIFDEVDAAAIIGRDYRAN